MKIGIHQPNLAPWLPYFYKMHKSDIFVVMINCMYEKNGFQNRFNVDNGWITKPVVGGACLIKEKYYTDGMKLIDVNMPLIIGFAKLLGINTSKIHFDFPTTNSGTARIIEICKRFDCDQYLTNPSATEKYLDAKMMNDSGVEIVGCDLPNQYKVSIFEALEEWGIDGCKKIINKDWEKCKV